MNIADFKVVQTLNEARQFLLQSMQASSKVLLKNAISLEAVHNLLSDESSKQAYLQEIAFLSLRQVAPMVANCLSPMKVEEKEAHRAEFFKLVNEKKLPYLKIHDEAESPSRENALIEVFLLNGYNYKDLVKVEPGEIFIDCGAFIGDTAVWAYQQQAAHVYSFEPCPLIWDTLKTNLAEQNVPVEFYPFALGKENSKLHFVFDKQKVSGARVVSDQELSHLTESGYLATHNMQVQDVECIRLDDWFAQNNVTPTYIKMDIEGSEFNALLGCAETIKKLKPKLAICLYHRVEDMWQIPLYLHSLVPEYKFYCQKNNVEYEFVLFATV